MMSLSHKESSRDISYLVPGAEIIYTQVIMQKKPQELIKAIVAGVGQLIKAENETLKTLLLAELRAVKTELQAEIKTLREESTKEHAEIMDKLTESNELHDKQVKDLDQRVRHLEGERLVPSSY